ncbi:hypothetical protein [Asticcacaulis sp. MM231]|uniref:hypothetical protein n=1 Tax=Asticcacaulis sp. MM231 TaxID=3157666 RepID=UPI0032D5A0C4
MQTLHHLNTLSHIGAGGLALLLGLLPLLSHKGRRLHRLSGWMFVAAGLVVLICAIIGVVVYPRPGPLVMVTLSASYQYLSGLRALPRFHTAPSLLDTLLALAALTGCGLLLSRMASGEASWSPAIGYSTLGFLAVVALYDFSRTLWVTAWRRIRAIDHGLKITATYFAFASAGLGNLARDWQPWSQIGPSLLGLIVMLLLLSRYIRDNRRRGTED